MIGNITCFYSGIKDNDDIIREFQASACVKEVIRMENLRETASVRQISGRLTTEYCLLYTGFLSVQLGAYALERMLRVAGDTGAGMLYADCWKIRQGERQVHPLIDYREGALRDDFDFGSLLLYRTKDLQLAVDRMKTDYHFAALYDLRLKVSRQASIFHLPEMLYTEMESDFRASGEKQFDYVNPRNREVQIEMEQVCTAYLKEVGAWLKPDFASVDFTADSFPVEATVIIPVRNREKTIEEAVRSVLKQKTSFLFNLIVVDNHSTDATSDILEKIATEDNRLIHLKPDREDLGIGGCWNTGIMHPSCGKFVIQLDSDDLYIDDQVITKIVAAFYEQQCAMVIGSYRMVNFRLEEIPPGLIDHREWTPENGQNNALRINGLGAPRAFYTPVLRGVKLPNVSYGEDYATVLAISRIYRIGRIYDPLYLCRRWEDNSDAALDIRRMNEYNVYKDTVRTIEFQARIKKNKRENG